LLVAAADLQCASRRFPGDKWVNTAMNYITFIVVCNNDGVL
jgi:hypothetical protein